VEASHHDKGTHKITLSEEHHLKAKYFILQNPDKNNTCTTTHKGKGSNKLIASDITPHTDR